jgi:hypothetical protein
MERPNHRYRRLRNAPRIARIAVGALLIAGGLLGFLPVLGFWMIPLGVVVIFIDVPLVKRSWSRLRQWWRARTGGTAGGPK